MENIEKCECWIGVRYDYENTDLVTLADLKGYIEREKRLAESNKDSEWGNQCATNIHLKIIVISENQPT